MRYDVVTEEKAVLFLKGVHGMSKSDIRLIIKIFLISFAVIAVVYGGFYLISRVYVQSIKDQKYYTAQSNYNPAVQLIQDGDYKGAAEILGKTGQKEFEDSDKLRQYAWALYYYYDTKNYSEAYLHLEKCIDTIRQHTEFPSPDKLMEEIKPLADKQREDTLKEIEEKNRKIAEQNAKKQETTASRKNYSYSPDDEYDVSDYYSAEDFYDDHYDDFFDYYDAEDYYNDHGGF